MRIRRLFALRRRQLRGCGTLRLLTAVSLSLSLLLGAWAGPRPAQAVQSVPLKLNFQGRLTNNAGSAMPDGLYNMTFRLYSTVSGGTASWTELREAGNRVQLTNGLFSVQLGEVTALPSTTFNAFPMYLEVELPTPATATCATAGCASWTEGAMTPRQALASSPYSFNANRLDGLDSSQLARLDAANTFTASQLFQNTTNSTSAFTVRNAAGSPLLSLDTVNFRVGIGTASPNAALEVSGALRLSGSTTDSFVTPAGSIVGSKLNVPVFTVPAYGQVIALGIDATSPGNSRVLSLFDNRTGVHQPTLGVFSVDEANLAGLSWEGASTTAYLKTTGGNLALRSGSSDLMTLLSGGNVGIGTVSPGARLEINSAVAGSAGIKFSQLNSSSATVATNGKVLSVDASGNVTLTTDATGTGGSATLQTAYDASTTPEITLNSTNGALTIRDNATPISGSLLEVQNNGGTITYLGVNSTTGVSVTGNLTFGYGGTNVVGVAMGANNTAGSDLLVSGGAAKSTTGSYGGGVLRLRGGAPAGSGSRGAVWLQDLGGGVTIGDSSYAAGLYVYGTGGFQTPINSSTAFNVANAAGTAIFNVDTSASRVGVNIAAAAAALQVRGTTSDATASAFIVDNAAGTQYLTVRNDGMLTLGYISSSSTYTFGYSSIGGSVDSGNSGAYNAFRVSTGPAGGSLNSISVYVGTIDSNAANQKYRLALYGDSGGFPGGLIGQSAEGTLTANSWNTLSVSGTLNANTTYWLAYMTNGSSASVNNTYYTTGTANQNMYKTYTYGPFPSTAPSGLAGSALQTSAYGTYMPTGQSPRPLLTIDSNANNLQLTSGADLYFTGSGNVRNAVTKDLNCSTAEAVNDVVIVSGAGSVGRTTTAGSNRVAGVVVAKPSSTVCTVAIAGMVQVNFGGNATPTTIGDPVQTSTTAGAAQSTAAPASGSVLGRSLSAKDGSNLVWVLLQP